MEYCHKIDNSLTERHTIVNLLESLKKDDITMEEMEKIGARLQKAGRRALSPLIRRLWREENGDHISRYVFLLDFFEDEIWIDQMLRVCPTPEGYKLAVNLWTMFGEPARAAALKAEAQRRFGSAAAK